MIPISFRLSDNVIIKFLSIYQITFGTLSLVWLLLSMPKHIGNSPFLYFLMMCLFIFSIISGYIIKKYKSEGLQLSLVNQYIQLLNIQIFGYGYSAHTGIAGYFGFTDKPDLTFSIYFDFLSITNSTYIYLNQDNLAAISVYLNIFPLILILLINRINKEAAK